MGEIVQAQAQAQAPTHSDDYGLKLGDERWGPSRQKAIAEGLVNGPAPVHINKDCDGRTILAAPAAVVTFSFSSFIPLGSEVLLDGLSRSL